MFGHHAVPSHQPKLQFPTNYHLQQQQQQQQTQPHPLAVPMAFANQQNNANNTGTPNNSFAASTIDPGLLQMTMDMAHLQNMGSLFPPTSGASLASNQALLARANFGSLNNNNNSNNNNGNNNNGLGLSASSSNNLGIKQEAASPDYLASEMDFGEPSNMVSPGSNSPLNSPLNDFDGPDDFSTPQTGGSGGATSGAFPKPTPLNIQPGSYGESPGTGSLYSPVESDQFLDGDFGSLPRSSRQLDMRFGRPTGMHPGSLPSGNNTFHSMSMPVARSDWFGGVNDGHSVGSYENPSGLQFAPGDMPMMDSLYEDGSDSKGNNRALLLTEKRRRRRESHNAVERRRRDNINEKIQELSTLLPDCYVDATNKPNKGVILRKSVDYIRHLQQLVATQNSRNQELEHKLQEQISTSNMNGMDLTGANGNMSGTTPHLQQGFGLMRIIPGGDLQN
ncbi:hypothetical protein BGZ98_001600 [Dissophora globulifera]|nr:hypothetical protein BGZ98_001600 [Dissophora globulifera]